MHILIDLFVWLESESSPHKIVCVVCMQKKNQAGESVWFLPPHSNMFDPHGHFLILIFSCKIIKQEMPVVKYNINLLWLIMDSSFTIFWGGQI